MNARRLLLSTALALLLGACASAPPLRSPEQQQQVERQWRAQQSAIAGINRFLLQARLGYSGALIGKGDVRWQQNANNTFELRISGPFGVGAATLTGSRARVRIRTRDGETVTPDPEQWFQQNMGWTFPIENLRYWVLGLPAPHTPSSLTLNDDGQAATIDQSDWHLDYSEYQDAQGYTLPRKFEATLRDDRQDVSLKVVIDDWSDLPTLH